MDWFLEMDWKEIKKSNAYKTVRAAAYVAVSMFLANLITNTTSNPQLLGPWTVVVNAVLVLCKNILDSMRNK